MNQTKTLVVGTMLCALLMWQSAPAAETAGQRVTLGIFRPSPALSLYVINPADSATGRLTIRRGARREGDRLMIRVFDPEERLTLWQYLEPGKLADTLGPGSSEIWGIPIMIPDTIIEPNDLLADMDLALAGKGVHQVRVTAGQNNSVVTVQIDHACDYGVSFQNGAAYPWDPAIKAAYLYVPPHAEALTLCGAGIQVEDETGKAIFPEPGQTERKEVTVPITKTGVVWTFRFADSAKWSFAAAGFPVILCNTKDAAETIKASVEVLPDGTVVCHKFQRRIAELLPTLLTPDKVGNTAELLALWKPSPADPAWLDQPQRNAMLIGGYGLFSQTYAALAEQNLDPTSHWSGSIGLTWKEKMALPAPSNRWDRLRSVPGLWAGASSAGNAVQTLAEAADLDIPLNPWRGRNELRWRAAASALRDLMTLGEDEVWRGYGADMNSYPGFLGFVIAKKHFREFALVAPHMPPEIRAVWTEGLRHVVDRHLPDELVSCMNQSSHYLVGWECFAQGSGDQRYTDLVRRYAQRFARSASPAGYFIENCGPDATYCGMQHFYMALYYRLSGDKAFLEAIRGSYRFFNHTVAPEPGGRVMGAFNFAHRTPDGFHNEQYGGAKGILDDVLPEVGLWAVKPPTDAERGQAVASLKEQLARPLPKPMDLDFGTPRYRYWTDKPDRTGTWPAEEKLPFTRNLANELIAVKRPTYYTAIYVGRPMPDEWYLRERSIFRQPLPDRAEDTGGEPWKYYYTINAASPLLGGGMSLFWTPGYGNAIFTGNCTPLAHHGIVAIDRNGVRWWEDYFATRFELDEKAGTLTITGQIEKQPLRYARTYRFFDDRVEIELRLETDQEKVELADLIENLPLLGGPAKANGQTISADNEQPVVDTAGVPEGRKVVKSTARSRTIRVADSQGRGVDIRLDEERPLRLCRSGMTVGNLLRFDRAEIVLPVTVTKVAPLVLRYSIVPHSGNQIAK